MRRFDFIIGVGLAEDLVVTLRIGLDALCDTAGVLDDPTAFGWVEGLGDSAVNLRFFAWIDQRSTDLGATKSAAMRRVKEAYDEAGIDLPEPTTRVLQREWEPSPKKPITSPGDAPPAREAPAADQIDAQIARERASSTEPDLLD